MNNGYISVSDKKSFNTIAEVCNGLFATSYKDAPSMGWFKPNTFNGTQLDDCKVWFPKLEPNSAGWVTIVKGDEIISKNANGKGKAELKQKNITFAYKDKKYTFAGIFELEEIEADGTEHWKRIDDKCPIISEQNKSPVASMLCLLFLAMLMAVPSYADVAKDLEDFKKSQRCGEETCPEYSGDFLVCLNRVGSDCEKKFANEKKDKQNKALSCTIEGGKKCKKEIDEALADSGGIEKIPGMKKFFSLVDSSSKWEKEVKKIEKDPDMMKAQKEKQLKLLEQKGKKLEEELIEVMGKQIPNAPIALKGIYIHDFEKASSPFGRNYEDVLKIKHSESKGYGWPRERFRYHIGRYSKYYIEVEIIVDEKFSEEAKRGIYDINGTVWMLDTAEDGNKKYGYDGFILVVKLNSAKYMGKK